MPDETVKRQSVTQAPDLLAYLRTAYEADPNSSAHAYDEAEDLCAVDRFIEWARGFMLTNQPVGLDFLSEGVGLRLQDATVVPYVQTPAAAAGEYGHDAGIPITRPPAASFRRGIVPDRSFGITGQG
jgi:hypothetical protein